MANHRMMQVTLGAALAASGLLAVIPGTGSVGATTTPTTPTTTGTGSGTGTGTGTTPLSPVTKTTGTSANFTKHQQALEQQLAFRLSQLTRVGEDVTGAKSLTPSDAAALTTNIGTATVNIKALIAKVPGDTTAAELKADEASMIDANRVFAVLTPQVFEVISSDATAARVAQLAAEEPSLQAAAAGLVGQPSYKNAERHDTEFVSLVTSAGTAMSGISSSALAQVPADYPGDTSVFVANNKALLKADIELAHASYDASVIGLATGGYMGA